MILIFLVIGLLLPTVAGWLAVGILQGRSPVLSRLEHWVLGFLFGLTGTMLLTFLAHIAGWIRFDRVGFLSVQVAVSLALLAVRLVQWRFFRGPHPQSDARSAQSEERIPQYISFLLILLTVWTLAKILFGSLILATTPPAFDDTLKNWNYRAKVFFVTHTLDVTEGGANTLSSYPPTVSLAKAELASLAGKWDDGLVDGIHALWLLSALSLLYAALRRHASRPWALLGTYVLLSLPLYLFHGVNAYADVFLSAHLLAAGVLLQRILTENDPARKRSLMRLGALALGLLVFTKNEALILYLPILLAIYAGGLFLQWRHGRLSGAHVRTAVLWTAGALLLLSLPWIGYKWMHGLGFGNAKEVSTSYTLGWQPGVPFALWVNTFFEGNWNLLFPLLIALVVLARKKLFSPQLAALSALVFAALLVQIGLFLFTSLSVEALRQTGLARGFVQMAPLVVLLTVLLARDIMKE